MAESGTSHRYEYSYKATTYCSLPGVVFNICIHVHKSIYASKTQKLAKSDFSSYMACTNSNTDDVVVWLETKNVERRATYAEGPFVTTEDSLSLLRDTLIMRGFDGAKFHEFEQALLGTNHLLLKVQFEDVKCVIEINKDIAKAIRATSNGPATDLFTVRSPFLPGSMSVDSLHNVTPSIAISGKERFNLGDSISTFLTLDEAVQHANELLEKDFQDEEFGQPWNDCYPHSGEQQRSKSVSDNLRVLTGLVASTHDGAGMKLWRMVTVTRVSVKKGKGKEECDLYPEEVSGPLLLKCREFSD